MKIGVLGTGMVGNAIGTKLIQLGHEVMMGARATGNEKATEWTKSNGSKASQGTFADAAAFAETFIFNCTSGQGSMEALKMAGEDNLKGKILVDISNPLDFSMGMPPSLTICNTDSLGETIQRSFPDLQVVKTLNTLNAHIMVNPNRVANGDHNIFLSGNDADAKQKTSALLQTFGWQAAHIIDLGDISTARGTEMLLPIWIRLYGAFGSPEFNFKIVR
ncbi:MAG: NAD(P)-binding domain-containing protein [Saprospiraceae bacterium]|nr:NAD(P)-binding domain-containing protein [Saprospiraceae bacterium]